MTQLGTRKLPRTVEAEGKAEEKKKKKEALLWLEKFGERLDAVCEKHDGFSKWLERAQELLGFLETHTDAVRPDWQAEIEKVVHDIKPVDVSLGKACDVLQSRVAKYIWHLDVELNYPWLAWIIDNVPAPVFYAVGITVVAVAVAYAGYSYLLSTSPQIAVTNVNCAPITFAGQPPYLNQLDVSLPATPIAAGQTGLMQLPPVAVTVDATQTGTLTLSVLGYTAPIPVDASLADLTFDGQTYGHGPFVADLALGTTYTLAVTCRA